MKRIILRDWEASAFYAGRLTQLRRLVKPQPVQPAPACHPSHKPKHVAPYFDAYCNEPKTEINPRGMSDLWCWWQVDDRQCLDQLIRCPLGCPGSRLWVAETWGPCAGGLVFRADGGTSCPDGGQWKPPVSMPRWASRSTVELTAVRVERVQEVAEEEAQACGSDRVLMPDRGVIATPVDSEDELNCRFKNGFQFQWECDHGQDSWDANLWVWVYDVRRVEK